MTFSIFATDDPQQWQAPYLFTSGAMALPPHPAGKAWRWVLTSSEEPPNALIGRRLVLALKREGWVISDLPLEKSLRSRPRAPTRTPVLPAR